MGVVNVTPDSFSDGGEFLDADAAIAHGAQLAAEGAAILDIGGESTRPGADPVPEDEELRRVVPVVEGLAAANTALRISIDTTKVEVARAALEAGASIVNDVSAFRFDPEMAALVAERGAECCLMHMLGEPRTMQADPRYDDVVADVKAFLEERLAFAVGEGVAGGARLARSRASASARPSSTTSSCCAGSTRSSRSGGRWWSARRARASSAS